MECQPSIIGRFLGPSPMFASLRLLKFRVARRELPEFPFNREKPWREINRGKR